ncbi:MAG: hypothetical protein IT282_10445, partial [Bacteroidetes bacterium]|nr:hypothetical protein [Bacteroidota bacterium]
MAQRTGTESKPIADRQDTPAPGDQAQSPHIGPPHKAITTRVKRKKRPSFKDHPSGSGPSSLDPALYINRELSWLEFNQRVLDEARDERHPLLERAKFLAIVSSNLDEFFMIRVAAIKEQLLANVVDLSPD